MPQNNFSVGRDVTLTIIAQNGPLSLNLITSFTATQKTTDMTVKGLDGITRPLRFFDGWAGSFALERQGSTVDDYFTQLEANYYAGINEQPVSITETITEVSGAVSQYRYIGALLSFADGGAWSGDATVKQTINFVASRRIKVS